MDRKSFVIYTASKEIVDMLNNEQSGILFKSILEYVTDGEPLEMDGMTKIVFTTIKNYLDKDFETYEAKCESNRINGRKGGRPKKNQTVIEENPKKPNGFLENPKNLEYDSDSEYDSESVYEKDTKGDKPNVTKRQRKFEPPSIEEVRQYIESKGYSVDAQRFVDYYEARGWELSKGRKIKDWKACVRTWNGNAHEWKNETQRRTGVTISEEQRSEYVGFDEFFDE